MNPQGLSHKYFQESHNLSSHSLQTPPFETCRAVCPVQSLDQKPHFKQISPTDLHTSEKIFAGNTCAIMSPTIHSHNHEDMSRLKIDPHKSSQISSTISLSSQLRTRQPPAPVQRSQFNPVLQAKYGMDSTNTSINCVNSGIDMEKRGRQQRSRTERDCKADAARCSPSMIVL